MANLQQLPAGGFQNTTRTTQLWRQQAALNEELQASKSEAMAVSVAKAAE
jgi:hypothetical protein